MLYREGERIWHHLAIAKITMRRLDEDFIESYLDRLGAAAFTSPASYQIENLGAQLLSRIDGCHFAILGLPLLELLGILREHGHVHAKCQAIREAAAQEWQNDSHRCATIAARRDFRSDSLLAT